MPNLSNTEVFTSVLAGSVVQVNYYGEKHTLFTKVYYPSL